MDGVEAVVHLAGRTGVMPSIADPEDDCDVNVRGTLLLLRAAVRRKVKHFIVASSSAPIGAHPPPMHERLPPRPTSPYGASKLAMEGYCSAFHASYGLPTVALRFSNCYGPGSRNKSSVVAQFVRRLIAGESLTIYGDGEQTRDFIFVDDLCAAIESVLGQESGAPSVGGEIYQVATGIETSLNRLVAMLGELMAERGLPPINVQREPARRGEVPRSYADISKFVRTFGYQPATTLQAGLRETWEYFTRASSV